MNTWQKLTLGDVRFLMWLHRKSQRKRLAAWARNLSRVGDGYTYAFIGITLWALGGENGEMFFYCGLAAYVLELSLYFILKNTIKRPRPHNLDGLSALISPSDTFSFPSGHTAGAFVFATVVAFFFPVFALPAYICAVGIGLSRVVLGVHYPSDIAAGAVLGTSCAALVLFLAT